MTLIGTRAALVTEHVKKAPFRGETQPPAIVSPLFPLGARASGSVARTACRRLRPVRLLGWAESVVGSESCSEHRPVVLLER